MQKLDLQYFGSVECFSTLINASDIVFSTAKRFKKEQALNRMWVAGANNLICLSVPLVGGRSVQLPYTEVRIAYTEAWQRAHWRTLHDCYRKAPWFDQYAPGLEQLYQLRLARLVEWNLRCTEWALQAIGLKSAILSEMDIPLHLPDQQVFSKKPLILTPLAYPRYHQVFEDRIGFAGNLSIVDLIFCEGPGAITYLKKVAAYKNAQTNAPATKENS